METSSQPQTLPLQIYFLLHLTLPQQMIADSFLSFSPSFSRLCVYFISSLYLQCLEQGLGPWVLYKDLLNDRRQEGMNDLVSHKPIPVEPNPDVNSS